jgi:DNA repair protein RadD
LGIAPTGAGKTVMLSSVVGGMKGCTSLVLQHRDELVRQNERTFRKVNPGVVTSFYTADYKRWGGDGTATFSMIQTLARPENLATMPAVDVLAVDEAHHVASDSYVRVIERARELNPKMMLFGVTATAGRGDNRNLRAAFDNVGDQIDIAELIAEGHLVRPQCFVIDLGNRDELAGVRRKADDFDMHEVEAIMNKRPINEAVVEKWREKAADRQTVVFCSTVDHCRDVTDEFRRQGVNARFVTGEMSKGERKAILDAYDRREFQVLVNVMVLTEGWDCQPVSCVLLLRPCSHKSTMIQMIGRGLRVVDPELYPGIVKDDCIVMDFGYSLLTHRSLSQRINLDRDTPPVGCPGCDATIPAGVRECPICGYEFPRIGTEEAANDDESDGSPIDVTTPLVQFVMTEIELFEQSPFKWEDFFDGRVTIANGFDAWATAVHFRGRWVAVCGAKEVGIRVVANTTERIVALQRADDFMREHGDDKGAKKSKQWLTAAPTIKQLENLGLGAMGAMGLSRYRASCALQWKFMERSIQKRLMGMAA